MSQSPQRAALTATVRALKAFKHALIAQDLAAMATNIDAVPTKITKVADWESMLRIICENQSNSQTKAALLQKVLRKLCAMEGWNNLDLQVAGACYWLRFDRTCIVAAMEVLETHSIKLGARLAELSRLHPHYDVFLFVIQARYKRLLMETSKFKGRGGAHDVRAIANAGDYIAMTLTSANLFYHKMPEKQARALIDDFVSVNAFTRRHHGLDHSALDLAAEQMNGNLLLRAMQFMYASGVNDAKYVEPFRLALGKFVAATRYDLTFSGHDTAQKYKAAKIQDMLDYLQGFWFSTFETTLYTMLRELVAAQLKVEPDLLKEINAAKHKIPVEARSGSDSEQACNTFFGFRYSRLRAVIPA